MKNLPIALILEKNKLATPNPWLILLDITLPDSTVLYLVKNTEDIVFQARTYTAFPFELDPVSESSKGEIPALQLRMSNVTRVLEGYLEELDGAIGTTVLIRIINAAHLSEDFSELEMAYDVTATNSDAQWITFSLGAPNPLRRPFPRKRYMPESCNWEFKSAECAYAGAATSCARTLDACRTLSNSARFGGFPGLSAQGVRLA